MEIFKRVRQFYAKSHLTHIKRYKLMKKASNQLTLNIDYRKLGVRIKPKGEKGYTPMSDEANHMCKVGIQAVVSANTGQNHKKPLDNY